MLMHSSHLSASAFTCIMCARQRSVVHFLYTFPSYVHLSFGSQAFVSSVSGMVILVDLNEMQWVSHCLAN